MRDFRVLTMNFGSTSTKVAIYEGDNCLCVKVFQHDPQDMIGFTTMEENAAFRKPLILSYVEEQGYTLKDFDAIVGMQDGVDHGDLLDRALNAQVGAGDVIADAEGLGDRNVNAAVIVDQRTRVDGIDALAFIGDAADIFKRAAGAVAFRNQELRLTGDAEGEIILFFLRCVLFFRCSLRCSISG